MNKCFLDYKNQHEREQQTIIFYNVSSYAGLFRVVFLFLFICMMVLLYDRQESIGQNDFFIRVVEVDGYSVLIKRDSIYKVSRELNFHIQGEQFDNLGFSWYKKKYLVELNGNKHSLKHTDVITVKPDDQIKTLVFYQINSFGFININIKKQEFRLE